MMLALDISNIAIIESLSLTLQPGFTVLSGETGAGKSILIEAVNALVGGRTSRELVRTGTDKASVVGQFRMPQGMAPFLEELGIEPSGDGNLVLQRVFTENGRNTCRVNGTLVTAGVLRSIGERLLDIHGQNDSQTLFRPETHLALLDTHAGESMKRLLAGYREAYQEYVTLKEAWRRACGSDRERRQRVDMLRYQLQELDAAGLQPGEDIELEQRSRLISHSESIVAAFSEAWEWLSGEEEDTTGAREGINRAVAALRRVAHVSADFETLSGTLAALGDQLDDAAREVLDVRDGTEFDPGMRDQVEERLSFLQGICRKYGESSDDCIRYREEIRQEIETLSDVENQLEEQGAQLERLRDSLTAKAVQLRQKRQATAKRLSRDMAAQLEELEMPKARFEADVMAETDREFDENGQDSVSFLFTANLGEPLKPLSRIASGGEMSRVMLALKTILADADRIPTLVFDEIDAGVGGKAAQKVGEKLAAMARTRQIFCVTHHAQIASLAEHHHHIGKEQVSGRTRTRILPLHGKEREDEITRLLSGSHRTETARGLARELLARGAAAVSGTRPEAGTVQLEKGTS